MSWRGSGGKVKRLAKKSRREGGEGPGARGGGGDGGRAVPAGVCLQLVCVAAAGQGYDAL